MDFDGDKGMKSGSLNITALSELSINAFMEPWERAILQKPALTDTMDAGNIRTSSMIMVNPKSSYRVGDTVTVRVDIRDGHGRQKSQGGDQVRVWMVDTKNQARQASDVTDMGNGSYISAFPLTWAGTINIKATLTYNAELIRAHFFIRKVATSTRFMAAGFETNSSSEATLCSPIPLCPGWAHLCNFTMENGGVPWYCGKPRNLKLDCHHWKYNFDFRFYDPLPLTKAEYALVNQTPHMGYDKTIGKGITIRVDSGNVTELQSSKPRCGSLPLKDRWTDRAPRGFFRKKVWHPLHCNLPVMSNGEIAKCLRNTTFLFLGDSNMRISFTRLVSKVHCKLGGGITTLGHKWHLPLSCINDKENMVLRWNPHGLPFHFGDHFKYSKREHVRQANLYIDEVPEKGRFIILVHIYLHMTAHHYRIFTTQMRLVRRSVERLLRRNPNVKVILRGPHGAYGHPGNMFHSVRGGDAVGPLFTEILKKEFQGLYDKVFFILPWDMAIAVESNDFHPFDVVQDTIMDFVLDYACHDKP